MLFMLFFYLSNSMLGIELDLLVLRNYTYQGRQREPSVKTLRSQIYFLSFPFSGRQNAALCSTTYSTTQYSRKLGSAQETECLHTKLPLHTVLCRKKSETAMKIQKLIFTVTANCYSSLYIFLLQTLFGKLNPSHVDLFAEAKTNSRHVLSPK